jgi:hypothetical protein
MTRYLRRSTSPLTMFSSLISTTYILPSRPVSSLESVHWQAWSFSTTSHSASVTILISQRYRIPCFYIMFTFLLIVNMQYIVCQERFENETPNLLNLNYSTFWRVRLCRWVCSSLCFERSKSVRLHGQRVEEVSHPSKRFNTFQNYTDNKATIFTQVKFVFLFSWRYSPLWVYFHSPVTGFSLLVFEVSWSHTTTRHSR